MVLGAAASAAVPRAQNVRSLALPARDLVHDPRTGRIYASVPSQNIIASIDPVLGRVERTLAVGSQPWQLALSDDGQYLYVGLDGEGAVRRVNIPSWTAELKFSLGRHPDLGPYHAGDIEVLPGRPQSVAVSRRPQNSLVHSIAVFDGAVMRRDTVQSSTSSDDIEFDANPARLYNLITDDTLRRLSVGPSGVSVGASFVRVLGGADLEVDDGRAYSSSGRVADAENGALIGTLPRLDTRYGAQIELDSDHKRVFVLAGSGFAGVGPTLSVYDTENFLFLGSMVINEAVRPGNMVRWGTDGIALVAADKLFLVRTPLVGGPAPDLSIRQKESLDPAIFGQPLVYVVTVTNQGSALASDVTVKDTLGNASLVRVAVSQGSYTVSGKEITARLGAMAPGAQAVIRITVRPNRTGILLRNAAVVSTTSEGELRPSNNEAFASTLVDAFKVRNRIRLVDLPLNFHQNDPRAKTLAYDRQSGILYASVPGSAREGNSLVPLDVATATTGSPSFVGSEPGRLEISGDGRSLYAVLRGAGAVTRFDLTSRSPDLWFKLGNDPAAGPHFAEDLDVLPGTPGGVAVSRSGPGDVPTHRDVAVFDDGNLRNRTTAGQRVGRRIEAASESRLYGLTYVGADGIPDPILSRMAVDETGVSVLDTKRLVTPYVEDALFADGRLYLNNGRVIDPETGRLLGAFPGVQLGEMELDLSLRKIFFLTSRGLLQAYDIETFQQIGTFNVPASVGGGSLVRWGASGLALRGLNVVALLDGPFVSSPNPPTDLAAAPEGATSIRLTWTDRSTNEQGFKIERKSGVNGFFIVVGTVGPNATNFTSTGLQPNSTYVYRVRAFGEGDYSLYSNEAKATTPINEPPAPNYLSASGISRSEIQLTWRFGGGNVAGYKVEQSKDGGKSFIEIGATPPDQTRFTVAGLTPGSTYHYRVRAFNAGGNSPYSNVASGTTLP